MKLWVALGFFKTCISIFLPLQSFFTFKHSLRIISFHFLLSLFWFVFLQCRVIKVNNRKLMDGRLNIYRFWQFYLDFRQEFKFHSPIKWASPWEITTLKLVSPPFLRSFSFLLLSFFELILSSLICNVGILCFLFWIHTFDRLPKFQSFELIVQCEISNIFIFMLNY